VVQRTSGYIVQGATLMAQIAAPRAARADESSLGRETGPGLFCFASRVSSYWVIRQVAWALARRLPQLSANANESKIAVVQAQRSALMGIQIVMDSSGDRRHEFDVSDLASIAAAEMRFRELTGKGFRAVALGKNGGSDELIDKFDPKVEQTLFIPQLRGG
jgi:hypothetical protein